MLLEKVWVAKEEEVIAETGAIGEYLLAIVLSVHSMMAGIALGAEEMVVGAFAIFIAIVAHKGAAGFSLGVSLLRGGVPRARSFRLIALFSIMTPLGIILGTAASAALSSGAEDKFEGAFDALAGGTFLYVAALDIIPGTFSSARGRWKKALALASGLGVMALLAVWK